MRPAEHYARAERCIDAAAEEHDPQVVDWLLRCADTHAKLACASSWMNSGPVRPPTDWGVVVVDP